MSNIKTKRIASQIAKEVSNILQTEYRDYNFKTVTITGAEVTSDLSFAKVYFTIINDDEKEKVLKEINEASGFIRKELADKIEVRHIPKITFLYDESIEYGNNIEKIIKKIHEENA